MSQIIYVLTNDAMPGLVKIGKTKESETLATRLKSLYTSGVPVPFNCHFAMEVGSELDVEKMMHDAFDDHRVNIGREFFEISPERVVAALRISGGKDITPRNDVEGFEKEEQEAYIRTKRRDSFNFGMVGIIPGSELVFSRGEGITCRVLDDKLVEYEGQPMSLSVAAQKAMTKVIGYEWKAVQGPAYWKFDGVTLDERRKRMEEVGE